MAALLQTSQIERNAAKKSEIDCFRARGAPAAAAAAAASAAATHDEGAKHSGSSWSDIERLREAIEADAALWRPLEQYHKNHEDADGDEDGNEAGFDMLRATTAARIQQMRAAKGEEFEAMIRVASKVYQDYRRAREDYEKGCQQTRVQAWNFLEELKTSAMSSALFGEWARRLWARLYAHDLPWVFTAAWPWNINEEYEEMPFRRPCKPVQDTWDMLVRGGLMLELHQYAPAIASMDKEEAKRAFDIDWAEYAEIRDVARKYYAGLEGASDRMYSLKTISKKYRPE